MSNSLSMTALILSQDELLFHFKSGMLSLLLHKDETELMDKDWMNPRIVFNATTGLISRFEGRKSKWLKKRYWRF